jgi:phosphodiesterase/alkaline phosphatase D-like protein
VESTGRVEIDPGGAETRVVVSNTPARQHEVLVDGLTPDSSVEYRVVLSAPDGTTEISSTVASFRTGPEDLSTDIRFAVIGDYGTGTQPQRDVRENLEAMAPQFVLTTGDNAYVSGSVQSFDNFVFGIYRDLMRSRRFFRRSETTIWARAAR